MNKDAQQRVCDTGECKKIREIRRWMCIKFGPYIMPEHFII